MKEWLYEEIIDDLARLRENDIYILLGHLKQLRKDSIHLHQSQENSYPVYRENLNVLNQITDKLNYRASKLGN
ncbi:hypothetical protein [Bacillus subtilis]|uniref:hypothetical protein n=1 Tax=Bacillus subtilis TaxID=1423 RepID=UPI001B9144D0|nr:hypothetical protein [Bacillus subtilis]MDN4185450.1 hypothetical protein [Bacillus subtilis]CAF1914842.1 hypothetical protein NRS6194_04144 [Bacillus subtilis]